jgi:hypothetical protein
MCSRARPPTVAHVAHRWRSVRLKITLNPTLVVIVAIDKDKPQTPKQVMGSMTLSSSIHIPPYPSISCPIPPQPYNHPHNGVTRASREAFSCSIGSGREPRLSDTTRGGYLSQGSAEAGPIFHMRHHTHLLSERCRILPIGHGNHQRQRLVRWHVGVSWVISVISVIAVIAVIAVIPDAIELQAPSSLQAARCTTCFTRPTPNKSASIEAAWLVATGSIL